MSRIVPRSLRGLRRGCVLIPILLLLVGAALTALLPPANQQDPGLVRAVIHRAPAITTGPPEPRSTFTAVIQTFNRTDLLLRLLNHYQGVPGLRRVVVVWNNVGQPCPQELWDRLGPHPVPVHFKEQSHNLMRNRLQPFAEIDTEAVLMLDDDTLVSLPDISFAFSVWKSFPDQIVGFVPRKHVTTASGIYSYGSFELQDPEIGGGDRYSMVLIGAAFFHRRYLRLFPQQPAAVLSLVDDTQNCDDIAVNFLVALHLAGARREGVAEGDGREGVAGGDRPSGVLVKPVDLRNLEKEASSGYLGMWHRPEHLLQRSFCLNRLAQIYGTMPLRYSNIMLVQFGFPNYANHKTRG